jgi:hypothetical protein
VKSHVTAEMRQSKSRAGVSMVEVMLAVLVTALGVAGVFGVSVQMSGMVRLSREETRSIEAAQHVMELVKTYSWVRLGLMTGTQVFDISDNDTFSDIPNAACTVSISPVAGEVGRLRRVSVFVTWQSADGTMVSRELTSLIARKRRLK